MTTSYHCLDAYATEAAAAGRRDLAANCLARIGRFGGALSSGPRPEGVQFGDGPEPANRMLGTIGDIGFLGSVVRVRVQFDTCAIMLDLFHKPGLEPSRHGAPVTVSFDPNNLIVLDVTSPS
jgi:putative spermidine/putrescine transport system ATP-binding protein